MWFVCLYDCVACCLCCWFSGGLSLFIFVCGWCLLTYDLFVSVGDFDVVYCGLGCEIWLVLCVLLYWLVAISG